MINKDRIVPVMATDLISLYGVILLQDSNNSGLAKLSADAIGEFQVKTNSAKLLAAEPVKKLDFDTTTSSVTAGTVYFVAAYDYEGFSIDGVDETPASGSVNVEADGCTLYKAVLASGDITITKVGF
jgi:hypothetical protein